MGPLLFAAQTPAIQYSVRMKPDTDNCIKFVLDALNGVAWHDDYQVVQINATKCYDSLPPYGGRTYIEFGAIGSDFITV